MTTTTKIAPLTPEQKTALGFLTGPDGAEARDGLSALEIADVICGVAQHAVAARAEQNSLRGADELSDVEKADLDKLLGRPSAPYERVLLRRTLRVLLPQ